MKKNRLLKQGLAVLLSLSMSLGPCAPGSFAAFADTAEVSSEVETGAGEAGADTKEEAGSQEESEVLEEKSEEAAGDSVSEGEEASNDNAGEISDGDASDRGEGVPGAGESDGNVEEAGESGEQDGGNSPEENYAAEYEADSEDGSENEGDPGAVGEETEVSKAEEADTASETAAPETETETAAVTENDETETESAAASEKDEAETEGEVKNSEDRHVLRAEIDETVISVIYDEGVFPENVVLEVRKVDEDSAEQEEIREKVEKALKEKEPAETEQEESGVWLCAFEIHVLDENQEEVEPDTEKGEVLVRFEGISFPGGEEEAVFGDDEITVFGLKSAGDDKVKELKQVNEAETELPDDEQFSADGKVFDDVSNIYDSGDISLYSVTVRLDSNQIIAFAGITSAAEIKQGAVKKEAEEKSPAFQAVNVIDGVRVLVTAPEGVFPEGSELSVKKITGTSETEKVEEALQAERDKGSSVALSYLFDIKILCNGEEIEPYTENGNVSVSFTLLGKKAPEKVQADVYHVTETEEKESGEAVLTAEKLETLNEIPESIKTDTSSKLQTDETSDTVISIETDSFSYYVVEFTYEALQYVLEGDTSVSLSAILWKLGFEGEVSEVSVSDDTLIGVSRNEDGKDWTVTALRAFNTEEWMDVMMDSFVYRITVTDDTASIPLYWGINAEGELKISTKELPSSYTGGTFDGGKGVSLSPWYWKRFSIKTGVIGGDSDIVQPVYTANWFADCEKVESIDVTYLDTSHIIDIHRMFSGCVNLTTLDISHFDTSSVTDMSGIFEGCKSLEILDVRGFDTSKATNIGRMFWDCANLTSLDVSGFNTSNATLMDGIFRGCVNLMSLDVGHFDTSNATSLSSMFSGCKNLTALDIGHFDTSNVTSLSFMFSGCANLTALDVSGFNTSNTTSMSWMFEGCKNLTTLDVSGFNTSNVTYMSNMFKGCTNLTTLDVSGFDTSNVSYMDNMFSGCKNLMTLDVSHFDTSKVTQIERMFEDCTNLTSLDVSGFDTSNVTVFGMSHMFSGCKNLTALDVRGFNTGKAESMEGMFSVCTNLTALDVSHFDTSKVTNLKGMFGNCTNLTTLDVSHFDTSKVTNLSAMFSNCTNLTTLDVSHFDTSKVTNLSAMFSNCTNLTALDLSSFDTSKVTDMSAMFRECENLTALDVSHFDTSNVTNTGNMFYGCKNLTMLDLSSFDTSKVTYMMNMFFECTSLVTIYAGEKWNTDRLMYDMGIFGYNYLLVGGAGTVYDNSHTGKEYARIDGGPDSPGYLTDPSSGSGTDSGIYNGWRISAEGYSYIKDGEPLKGGPYGLTFLSDGIVFEGNWLFDNDGYAVSGLHNGAYYYDQRNGLYPYGMQVPEEDIRQKLKTGRSASATFYSFDHYRTFTDDLNFFQILLLALPSEGLKEIFGRNMNAIGKLAYKLIEKWAGKTKSTNWNEVFYKIENSYYWDTSTNKKVLSSLLDEMFNDNSDFNREKKTAQKVAKAVDLSSDVLSKTCEALLSEKQETAGAGNTDLSESGRSVMEKIDNDDTGKAFFNTAKQFASLTKYLYETTDDFRKAFSDYSDRIAYLEELETAILSHDKDKSGALLDAVRELKDNYEKDMTIAMVDAVYTGLNEIDGWYGLFTGKDTESLPDISLSNNISTNIGNISTFLAKKGLNALTGGLLGIGIAGIETIQKLDGRSPALYDYIETLALMEDAQELLKSAEANLKKDECTAYDLAAYFAAFELTRQLYLLQYKAFKAFYQADSDNHGDKELFLEEEINKLIQLTPLNYDAEDLRAGDYNAYWNETEQRYYYRNGEYIKNRWCWLDKKAYYFDAEGHPLTGKQNMTPYTGEVDDDGGPAYYYFSTGTGNAPADQDHYGAMQLGVIVTEDKRYYTEYGKLKRNRRPFAPPYYFTNDDAEILNPDGFADGKNHAVGETPWEWYIRMGASGDTAFNINVVQVLHPSAGAGGLNVIVYNENETQIGAVDGDTITILDEDAVDIRNDSSGSIFIYTLYGNNVRTEIQAEADTMIDYSVVEFSGETMFKRIDYRDIRLGSGGKAVALADYQEDTEYSLMKDQEEQTPDETQTDMVFHAVKVVVTGPNPTEYTRMILKGDTVDLTVEQQGNSAFKGWYSEDGELLSTDLAYCVRVMEDLNLTAVFEEAGVEAFITRLYRICLSREADSGGLEYWKGRINSGSLKGIGLASEFVFSKEFKSKNYCNEHFVKQIYPALMGREPDAGGLTYWVGQLDSGKMNRESLLNSFTSSAEYKNLCTEAGIELGATMKVPEYGVLPYGPCAVCGKETKVVQFAERMYTVCLGRAAETGGLAYWSKGLYEQTITGQKILNSFFLSSEIKNKNLTNREYVRRIYKAMLDRDPDTSGWDYWEGRLNSGVSPTAVIAGFIDSKEFTGICEEYGIKRK